MKEYINRNFDAKCRPIAEWERQSGVQLTWPHAGSDWDFCLSEVVDTFREIARAIVRFERVLIVCEDAELCRKQLGEDFPLQMASFYEIPSNDTWARDHSAISVRMGSATRLVNFVFNGWGMKFAACRDNQIAPRLHSMGAFSDAVEFVSSRIVCEGGGLDFDSRGNVLATTQCLCSLNRNEAMSWEELNSELAGLLHYRRLVALENGGLCGDDTDSHIDTLARFCDDETIAYVKCYDADDEHFVMLNAMEKELRDLRTSDGKPYKLVALPLPKPIYDEDERLPATYANFLILNGAVLVPTYAQESDMVAIERLKTAFPNREIVGIDCRTLIRQHGSLHCVTMQYAEGVLK